MRPAAGDYTLVVAVDERTQHQLRQTWPTWRRYRAEFLGQPMRVICDARVNSDPDWWRSHLHWLDHPDWKPFLWDWPTIEDGIARPVSQRERMLTAFVRIAPAITTSWYLKLDTDVVAASAGPVVDAEWLRRDAHGAVPVLVASPWGYTKPGHWVDDLQQWADAHADLRDFPRLDLPSGRGQRRFGHRRICSWICLINTAFGRLANQMAPPPGPLPVPSQDTYHWYVAARRAERIEKVRFNRRGWHTISKDRVRAEIIKSLMGGEI